MFFCRMECFITSFFNLCFFNNCLTVQVFFNILYTIFQNVAISKVLMHFKNVTIFKLAQLGTFENASTHSFTSSTGISSRGGGIQPSFFRKLYLKKKVFPSRFTLYDCDCFYRIMSEDKQAYITVKDNGLFLKSATTSETLMNFHFKITHTLKG